MKPAAHQARKRFGQNFLEDDGIIGDIVAAIHPRSQDCMVEIGPGLAALTTPLLDTLEHLHVVEIDRDLIARLKQRFKAERLTIHEGDALAFDFGRLATTGNGLRVVGNLPYNISTPLLFHLATYADSVRDMHFMLQKEVVERMVAEPGSSEYGRLSVMLQYRFAMELLFIVPPTAFNPPPKVDSAIVRMVPLPAAALMARDEALFARVVSAAFSQRRKMLRNTLRALLDEAALAALGIAPTARAEDLSVAEYVRIANTLVS
ncbi:MAG: 16S rRNA (adenine(1518)-N(6)/adenine(1519)-N(6))-dimethyltransferase RsmA [Sterolibacterium sp.]|nr:16S rRNA (adenine(1518)-N(6)/adenine(1519)-N(6))-dimethyltransferase RsmA [Sterolibacterium sp.]MBP9799957.1 16S rRNA (adenine(1518)-N(6)/adenine(1519)-N(6))-dimethyltransferase RsmA [Sterolibacterium sp.]